ncbi:MACPF domain-containing protein [Senna tora]|uniref:MACPF domain-containing protein n=1 Tax=Senna tora TaxID=362788 RepID=A0A834WLH9_9FABA|nr:MACPF domain-containing protein [Senna tora]
MGSRLIIMNDETKRNLEIPGGVSIPNVPNSYQMR